MSDEELVKRLRNFDDGATPTHEAADRIEALTAEQDRLSSKVDTLELLRPHWAQGYSSDSVAAQASTAALVAFWEILGVSDQTSAINALKALTDQLAKAVEALRFVVSAKGLTDPTEYGYEAIKQARATLAEIEGTNAP
jgi:hypothetical protein